MQPSTSTNMEQIVTPIVMRPRLRPVRSGYSLIEVVVYVAILAVVSVTAVNTLLLIHRALAEIRTTRSLNAAAAVAMERMVRVIRDAERVDSISGTTLKVVGDEVTYTFTVDGASALTLDTGSGAGALTPPGVVVSGLTFEGVTLTTGGKSEAVKVVLTLQASSGKSVKTQSFYGTAVLRNSYSQ